MVQKLRTHASYKNFVLKCSYIKSYPGQWYVKHYIYDAFARICFFTLVSDAPAKSIEFGKKIDDVHKRTAAPNAKEQARQLYKEGNALFENKHYSMAAEKYEKAIDLEV